MQPLYNITTLRQEVEFRLDPPLWQTLTVEDRLRTAIEIDQWIVGNLPYDVKFEAPTLDRDRLYDKRRIRSWLNKNIAGQWTYTKDGVAFQTQKDAALYRLFFG